MQNDLLTSKFSEAKDKVMEVTEKFSLHSNLMLERLKVSENLFMGYLRNANAEFLARREETEKNFQTFQQEVKEDSNRLEEQYLKFGSSLSSTNAAQWLINEVEFRRQLAQ